jgi:hypothetical protein
VTVTESPAPLQKTPQACLDALDNADRGFDLAFKIMDYFDPAMDAVLDMDVSKVHRLTRKTGKAADKMGDLAPKYNAAKAECQASA